MNSEWKNIPVGENKTFTVANAAELKQLADKHPYSFLHQFLYTKKLKGVDDARYKKQASKTALYSSNLPWLEFILHTESEDSVQTKYETEIPVTPEINTPEEIIEESKVTDESIEEELELFTQHEPVDEGNSLVSGILDREKEIAQQETELKFEPLYTVDYFASQGIKNVTEQIPSDKLGKQLKSFTEWLKVMKRLPAEETTTINESDEKNIQAAAEGSNEVKDITTEAMADVLIKQGKQDKALEIYHKLSLQHPEKSPYFAALIEQLKG